MILGCLWKNFRSFRGTSILCHFYP